MPRLTNIQAQAQFDKADTAVNAAATSYGKLLTDAINSQVMTAIGQFSRAINQLSAGHLTGMKGAKRLGLDTNPGPKNSKGFIAPLLKTMSALPKNPMREDVFAKFAEMFPDRATGNWKHMLVAVQQELSRSGIFRNGGNADIWQLSKKGENVADEIMKSRRDENCCFTGSEI